MEKDIRRLTVYYSDGTKDEFLDLDYKSEFFYDDNRIKIVVPKKACHIMLDNVNKFILEFNEE